MSISREAVEAAARAAYEFRYSGYKSWDELTPVAQCDAEAEMQYALLAAAPHVLADSGAVQSELKFLRGERKSLMRNLASWEAQGHKTLGIDFMKRHLTKKPTP